MVNDILLSSSSPNPFSSKKRGILHCVFISDAALPSPQGEGLGVRWKIKIPLNGGIISLEL